jgi:hypothetical protein
MLIVRIIRSTVWKNAVLVSVSAGGTYTVEPGYQVRTQNFSFGGGGELTLRLCIILCLVLKIVIKIML